jgi:hypothetical protein
MVISNLSRRVCLPLPSPAELDNAESGDPAPTSKPLTAALELRRSLLIDMDYALIVDLTKPRSNSSVGHRIVSLSLYLILRSRFLTLCCSVRSRSWLPKS